MNGTDVSVVAGWITVLAEGRVAAKVDHDIRTPLKIVKLHTNQARDLRRRVSILNIDFSNNIEY